MNTISQVVRIAGQVVSKQKQLLIKNGLFRRNISFSRNVILKRLRNSMNRSIRYGMMIRKGIFTHWYFNNKYFNNKRIISLAGTTGVTSIFASTTFIKRSGNKNDSTSGGGGGGVLNKKEYKNYAETVNKNVESGYNFRGATYNKNEDSTMIDDIHNNNIRDDGIDYELQEIINIQINLEFSANLFYRSLYAFFNRDNVGLHNIALYFLDQSNDETIHGIQWIDYMNQRGGNVILRPIAAPPSNYSLLDAFTLAMKFEKRVHDNLKKICQIADKKNDPHLNDFATGFLQNQYFEMYKLSQKITKLKRMDLNSGTDMYLFDTLEFKNVPGVNGNGNNEANPITAGF